MRKMREERGERVCAIKRGEMLRSKFIGERCKEREREINNN